MEGQQGGPFRFANQSDCEQPGDDLRLPNAPTCSSKDNFAEVPAQEWVRCGFNDSLALLSLCITSGHHHVVQRLEPMNKQSRANFTDVSFCVTWHWYTGSTCGVFCACLISATLPAACLSAHYLQSNLREILVRSRIYKSELSQFTVHIYMLSPQRGAGGRGLGP